ncbi:hypothetical protein I4U23_013064 [Adineta vaga]|nr:hypothetical protein I4U23_013064 [Adineta vaga]
MTEETTTLADLSTEQITTAAISTTTDISSLCDEQNSTKTPTNDVTTEKKPVEVTANPNFISWECPPYCELCNVSFTGESVSKNHFDSQGHKNKLQTWRKYQNPETTAAETKSKNVLCDVCWKEMNTQAILDTHLKSPAHLKLVTGHN